VSTRIYASGPEQVPERIPRAAGTAGNRALPNQRLIGPPSFESQATSGMPRTHNFDVLTPTIFHETWWLETATGGRYGKVESSEDGHVVGRMPYFLDRRLGMTLSLMPPLTHFLGPAVDDGKGSVNTRFLRRLAITRDLIQSLPRVAYFSQKLHRGVSDVLAFQSEGYDSSVQFTHEIAPQTEAAIWNGLRHKTRNKVRNAENDFVIDIIDDPDQFIRFYADNLTARHMESDINLPICRALIAGSLARDCGRIYAARRRDGSLAAAAFCAWDQRSAYYLMSTRAPDSGNNIATLLLWSAIKDATGKGLIFDFDGVPSAGAVVFYASFGAAIQPRYIVSTSGKFLRVANTLRLTVVKRSKFF
jgi:hypothetical protein